MNDPFNMAVMSVQSMLLSVRWRPAKGAETKLCPVHRLFCWGCQSRKWKCTPGSSDHTQNWSNLCVSTLTLFWKMCKCLNFHFLSQILCPLTISLHCSNEVSVQKEVNIGEIGGGSSVHHHLIEHLKHTNTDMSTLVISSLHWLCLHYYRITLTLCALGCTQPWLKTWWHFSLMWALNDRLEPKGIRVKTAESMKVMTSPVWAVLSGVDLLAGESLLQLP